MLKSVEANTVVVSDDMDKGIKAESSITLGISDNHKVQYWDAYAYNCCDLQDSTLTLTDYVGTILLPINATIHLNTKKTIDGIIASPAYIEGNGNLDLTITKESNLELCLATSCRVIINNETALPGIDSNQKHNFYLGRNYEHFEKRYIQYLEDIKSKLNTKQDNKIQNKFTAQSQYSIQNVCLHFNLIYIEKDNGLIKLQYDIPKLDTQEEREVYYKNKLCKRLEREIADAYKTEDYRIIPDANNRLNILKAEIESINKVLDKNL